MKSLLQRQSLPLFIVMVLTLSMAAQSQHLHGTVTSIEDGVETPLPQAHVYWLGTSDGDVTDENGRFDLMTRIAHGHIVVSHVSWRPDTIEVGDRSEILVRLEVPRSSAEVEVTATAPDTYIAAIPQRTEVITATELEKASCCDLAGCFGTTSSVQPEATDVITDTRQLTMLGLGGVYTQVLIDNISMPGDRLNQQFGMQSLPGPWIDKIYVSKGSGGVGQGASSVSGLINVLLLDGLEEDRVFFNAFGNNYFEQQYNAYATTSVEDWKTILALHGTRHGSRKDRDGDSFMDAPIVDRFSLLNKWSYLDEEEGVMTSTGVRVALEDRIGGQMDFNEGLHRAGTSVYGQRLQNTRTELYNRSDLRINDETMLRTHAVAAWHKLDAYFGTTSYDARQYSGFADAWLILEPAEEHLLTVGASWSWTDLRETVDLGVNPMAKSFGGAYRMIESVPGVFVESKMIMFDDAVSLITGVRLDHHSGQGIVMTPRMFLRYILDDVTTLRLSAGTAYRTPTVFSEFTPLLASWRDIIVPIPLQAERAVNYGLNVVRHYDLAGFQGTLTMDVYRTEFRDQVIADFDLNPTAVVIRNIGERTTSNHFMLESTAQFPWGVSLRASYMLTDAVEYRGGERKAPPFVSRHRALAVMTADFFERDLTATLTAEWKGPQNLPDTENWPVEFRLPSRSPSFTLLNAHINANLGRVDVYMGLENILDFRQNGPIINARRPFDAYFEPTFSWGPVKGREIYAGTRLRIGEY